MKTEFAIRQMTKKDLISLKHIIDLSFPRFFRFFATQGLNEEGHVLVTEIQGKVVGFAKLTEFLVNNNKFGCILWVAVLPQARRKGIANVLVEYGTKCLKQAGAKAIFASVQRRNKTSLSVFILQGFGKIGFLGLWQLFSWRVFEFYRDIWFAPGEIVLMHS
jgi:ribosomal protein S18 acetylase RimI-like enzyme